MRRYAVMQKARDADVIGLLVGNVNLGSCFFPSRRDLSFLSCPDLSSLLLTFSQLSPTPYPTSNPPPGSSQEDLHPLRRKAQPSKTRQLRRDRMLRSHRLWREQSRGLKGQFILFHLYVVLWLRFFPSSVRRVSFFAFEPHPRLKSPPSLPLPTKRGSVPASTHRSLSLPSIALSNLGFTASLRRRNV